jgi:hypothetical protein
MNGFDSQETYARMNHLIDVIRGNMSPTKWTELTEEFKEMYLEECKVAEYLITEEDLNQLEPIIIKGLYK